MAFDHLRKWSYNIHHLKKGGFGKRLFRYWPADRNELDIVQCKPPLLQDFSGRAFTLITGVGDHSRLRVIDLSSRPASLKPPPPPPPPPPTPRNYKNQPA